MKLFLFLYEISKCHSNTWNTETSQIYSYPIKDGYLEISETSEEHAAEKEVKITNQERETATFSASEESQNLKQSYVVIEEGSKKWVGYIDHQDEEFGDYHIRFLHPAGIRTSYYFPNSEKEHCFKSNEDIIGVLPTPNLKSGTRIQDSFPNTCLRTLMNSS